MFTATNSNADMREVWKRLGERGMVFDTVMTYDNTVHPPKSECYFEYYFHPAAMQGCKL